MPNFSEKAFFELHLHAIGYLVNPARSRYMRHAHLERKRNLEDWLALDYPVKWSGCHLFFLLLCQLAYQRAKHP